MSAEERQKLPEGWRWVPIKEIGPITDGDWILNADYSKGGIRLLQVGDVGIGRFIGKSSRFISRERAEQLSCTLLHAGDVLISRMPLPIGRACILPDLGYDCITAVDVSIWRPNESIADKLYLVHYLSSSEWFLRANNLASGATRARISRTNLEQESVPLPPLPEQKRIAMILTEQMAAVEKARAAAEARQKAAKELPAAYLREVFEGEEAKGWPRKALGEVCDITAPLVDPKKKEYSSLPHVFGNNIESGMCRLTYLNSAAEDGMTSGKYLFKSADVLYSKLRPYLRKVIVAEFDGLCSADMYPIEVNRDILDPHFTAWMLLSEEFTTYADEQSRRARMPKLNRDQLFAWKAPVPPLNVQRQLMERHRQKIAQVEVTQRLAQEEVQHIEMLPAALLRQAFQGEL